MKLSSTLATGATLVAGTSAGQNYLGFNSGATLSDQTAKLKADFEAEFNTAQNLVGAPGTFNSVRLYTNIQAGTQDDPSQAFEAAIATKTNLLLGVWASGTQNISAEIDALSAAVQQYGTSFTDLVIAISIGSEDLYRNSATSEANNGGVGNDPQTILGFINDYRAAFANTSLAKVPVGHVDTWDAWVNGTNKPVLDAVDWVGVDEYPFYEIGKGNGIDNASTLFDQAYNAVLGVAGNKPVWVTETGWPISGATWDEAVPGVENAKTYWDTIGCGKLFNQLPTFWYDLRDSNAGDNDLFAISSNLSTNALFNLTCPATSSTANSTGKSGTQTNLIPTASSASGSSIVKSDSNSTTASQNAGPVKELSVVTYAGVALVAGVLALF